MKLLVYQFLNVIYFKDFDKIIIIDDGKRYKLSSYQDTPKELLLRFIETVYIGSDSEGELSIKLLSESLDDYL